MFSKFQVSEVFDVPPVLVNRRQADPHAVQCPEVHSGDKLWRDHQDANQWTCHREEEVTNPGVTFINTTLWVISFGTWVCSVNCPSGVHMRVPSRLRNNLLLVLQSTYVDLWVQITAKCGLWHYNVWHLHRNMWTITGDQVFSTSPSTRQTSSKLWVSHASLSSKFQVNPQTSASSKSTSKGKF